MSVQRMSCVVIRLLMSTSREGAASLKDMRMNVTAQYVKKIGNKKLITKNLVACNEGT